MARAVLKTYGKLWLGKSGKWFLRCEPHVVIRLKRIFHGIWEGERRNIKLSNTDANCRDLQWFCERYPLEIDPKSLRALEAGAQRQLERVESVVRILDGDFQLPSVDMALPTRPYQEQAAACVFNAGHLLLVDEIGLGKQQPVDTKVLTPSGWTEIGDVKVGDYLIGSSGHPTKVLAVHPQGIHESYRVHFSDGSSVEAGDEHLWSMRYLAGGKRWQDLVLTTKQLRLGESIEQQWSHGRRTVLNLGNATFYLPMLSGPVQSLSCASLPVQPYLLGALIANGHLASHCTRLTVGTDDLDEILSFLKQRSVSVGSTRSYGSTSHIAILGKTREIKSLGLKVLSRHKFIPQAYMTASVDDRIELLHGLMDGDGSCSSQHNRVVYHTISLQLANDIVELIECLGGAASVRAYDREHEEKSVEYQVRVRPAPWFAPFTLRRKASRYSPRKRFSPTRTFVKASYARKVESVCIEVEAGDGLYATEHAILTHNTASAIRVMADHRALPALAVVPAPLTHQWKNEIHKFAPSLHVHIIRKREPYDLYIETGGEPHVLVTSYAKLSGWSDHLAGKIRFVVFDEAQELRSGQKAAKNVAAAQVASLAQYRAGLTATPIYNYGGEIWNVLNVIAPGALGEQHEFLREWCNRYYDERKATIADPKAFGTYLRDTGLMLRRTRDDVGRQLPPVSTVIHEMAQVNAEAFEDIETSAAELARVVLDNAEKGFARMQAGAHLDALLRQATGVSKAPGVAALVRMIAEQEEKIVLFGWHREVYGLWAKLLEDLQPAWYTGSESPAKKRKETQRFLEGDSRVLFMSLRSGLGLNGLEQVCATAVHGELDWSPGVHEQCNGRLQRDGQRRPVFAYYPIVDSGSDPIVVDVLGLKTAQVEGLRDPDGAPVIAKQVDPEHIKKLAEYYLRRSKP